MIVDLRRVVILQMEVLSLLGKAVREMLIFFEGSMAVSHILNYPVG